MSLKTVKHPYSYLLGFGAIQIPGLINLEINNFHTTPLYSLHSQIQKQKFCKKNILAIRGCWFDSCRVSIFACFILFFSGNIIKKRFNCNNRRNSFLKGSLTLLTSPMKNSILLSVPSTHSHSQPRCLHREGRNLTSEVRGPMCQLTMSQGRSK